MRIVYLGSFALLLMPLTGWMADRISLYALMGILVSLPGIGFVLSRKWRRGDSR